MFMNTPGCVTLNAALEPAFAVVFFAATPVPPVKAAVPGASAQPAILPFAAGQFALAASGYFFPVQPCAQ